ncbi:hypothetical protein EGT74_03595 [Chitinophaga lutea]|uniref:Uncharacterized protein n=1 Tax=Chitinophaga lutea TaxID=2488634 RepID=A0A3N4QLT5_9BACT|nr:hypothetical protein [Chitinophaga lutea]RPE12644.1 hypothetical protein EGT74_03595 [Chitinophaga lutea]
MPVAICFLISDATAQQFYNEVYNHYSNVTPVNTVKIKTNLPVVNGNQQPTIIIEGFNYSTAKPIGIMLTYHTWFDGFYAYKAPSFGAYTPPIFLANEGGNVVIVLDDRGYYQRFSIRVFSGNGVDETPANFSGWTVVDESVASGATAVTAVPYENSFAGNVFMPGGGIWNSAGKVGIGTTDTKGHSLAVNGSAIFTRVIVKNYSNWPDYVFDSTYQLASLRSVERYITANKRLPGIPAAGEVMQQGVDVAEMQQQQMKKIEELTLYIIELNKKLEKQQALIETLMKSDASASSKQFPKANEVIPIRHDF